MKTRRSKTVSHRVRVDWVDATDVSAALDSYTRSILQAGRMRSDYEIGSWCIDQNRNQVKGCRCVFDLRGKTRNTKNMRGLEYATVCSEMATWFSAAKDMEGMLAQGEVTQLQFDRAFHCSTALKGPVEL